MKHSIGLLYHNTLERELLLSRANKLSELEYSSVQSMTIVLTAPTICLPVCAGTFPAPSG